MNHKIIVAMLLAAVTTANAQNPIIRNQFSADPTARVFNGRLYLYPSHDIPPCTPDLISRQWFCMEDYHVFSSDDLTEWTDHGVIISQNQVPWVEPNSYSMWAPDCVEKDGTYYFYFPSTPKGQQGFGVGVATSSSPEGPFRPMPSPIQGVDGIDPCVLLDDDGRQYIYWSGKELRVAQLQDNMMALQGESRPCEGLPAGFKEGPFAFKRQGKYYLTFPWIRKKDGAGATETLAYAMADNPMGPFEFKGVIMDEWPNHCWTNHHSLVEYKGQWYLFYHHNDYSPKFDKNRSVCADSLTFNPDGTIQPVVPTHRGVGLTKARSHIQMDRYSAIGGGASIDYLNEEQPFEGWKTLLPKKGAWVQYNSVSFPADPVQTVTVKVKSERGAKLCLSAISSSKNEEEKVVIAVPAGKEDWQTITAPLAGKKSPAPLGEGVKGLKLTLLSGSCEVDWIGFDALPWQQGAFQTGQYRNLFLELGHTQQEIDAKVDEVFQNLFFGPNRIYFEVGDSMAYISDIKNHDVRTEGMSYGLMIAVQLDKKDIFDRLWRWSKHYMQDQKGFRKGYFAWSLKTDGTRNSEGSASDGELYFITSLIFANNRWGSDGEINYLHEAQNILDCSMQKAGMDYAAPLINLNNKLITFTPDNWGNKFTDPSYHIPAFYEVWARWAQDGRSGFWRECARAAYEYLHRSVHPVTGLTPDYNNYDGTLMGRKTGYGDTFRFDSWRVPMNIAMDYSWSCADRQWQQQYADRIQSFLYNEGIDTFVDQYNVDGSTVEEIMQAGEHQALRHSVGFVATAAAASLAATHARSREFVERLWDSRHEPYEDGYFDAYYDGLLRLFAFMHLSGKYRLIPPRR